MSDGPEESSSGQSVSQSSFNNFKLWHGGRGEAGAGWVTRVPISSIRAPGVPVSMLERSDHFFRSDIG